MGRVFQVGTPSRRDIGTGRSESYPVPWPRRDRDGLGRVLPRIAKKSIINLKVIIKVINVSLIINYSYLILSISLFGFGVVAALESGTIGKGRDGFYNS